MSSTQDGSHQRGEQTEDSYSLHATESGNKCWPNGPLGLNADMTSQCNIAVQVLPYLHVLPTKTLFHISLLNLSNNTSS